MGTNADDDGRNYIAVAMPKDENEVYVNQFTTSGSTARCMICGRSYYGRLSMSKDSRFSKVYEVVVFHGESLPSCKHE